MCIRDSHKTESDLIQNRRWNCSSEAHAHNVESDLVHKRRWNSSSKALNWLNTHHSRNKRGLGIVNRPITKPIYKKYVGLKENITCFHCGKTGHYRHTCLLRKRVMERNSLYVKQIWIRKDELNSMTKKRIGPKKFGFPRLTTSYFAG